MAGYSRSAPKSKSSPNVILVIFLVLFILISIGAGVWGYYGYEGQEELKKLALAEKSKTNANIRSKEYYAYLAREFKLIVGEKLNEEEKSVWKADGEEFMREKGRFENETNYKEYKELIQKIRQEQKWDDKVQEPANPYTLMWRTRNDELKQDNDKLKGDLVAREKENSDLSQRLLKTTDKYKESDEKLTALLKSKGKEALDAILARSAEMIESFNRNSQLLTELSIQKEQHKEDMIGLAGKMRMMEEDLRKEIAILRNPKAVAGGGGGVPQVGPKRGLTEPQPLVLDVSMGKPLFDIPVAIVAQVIDERRVKIKFLTSDRIQERIVRQLTFNVFGNDADYKKLKPVGPLKATMEIIAVLGDPGMAEAQITYTFSKDNPVRAGDLLYNLTWGTHVAIVGSVNLFAQTVSRTETLDDRARNLATYISKLEERGIIVDAYVDLTTGAVLGKNKGLTNKTRFLIRGYDLPEFKTLPKDRAEAKPDDAVVKHLLDLRDAFASIRNDAVARGLFIISPENFANVAGYRKIGGYAANEVSFIPSLPMVGN